ncbi:MAG: sulfatase-like hydrolase/transferase [bacterium]|nr:sulfatase-like hydrolase/transferase [bacterium]
MPVRPSRRDFVQIAGAATAALCTASASAAAKGKKAKRVDASPPIKRPNVLFLHTDQQRWDTIRAAGFDYMITPNLDKLAKRGVLFQNAFTNNPVCMPSRQSMLSGLYPSTLGCCINGVEMPEDVETIHTILARYGYHTGCLGKLHFKNHATRDHRAPHPSYGFDHLVISDEPGCYDDAYIRWVEARHPSQVDNCRCSTPPAWAGKAVVKHGRKTHEPYDFEGPEDLTHSAFVADETVRYIQQHKDEPFFCFAGFYAPHCPVNPPKRFADMYDPATMPLPAMREDEHKRFKLSDDEWRKVRAYYYALITHVDDQIGRILDALEEEGILDNTLIVFTSDHGDHLGDHGTVAKGPPGLDSCVHVPLIVSWPGAIESGREQSELVELVDLAPTILDYCGVPIPPGFQGRSLHPLLEGDDYEKRSSAFIEFRKPFGISWKVVRGHDYKYGRSNAGAELLYDLKADPNELNNVAKDPAYADAIHAMRNELVRRWFEVESQYPLQSGPY